MKMQGLTKLFPLYRKNYILRDIDSDIWIFSEYFDNGIYPRYSLIGKTVKEMYPSHAKLFCAFRCQFGEEDKLTVFIEDIFTTKRGRHIGSWMMNQLIELLRRFNNLIFISEITGEFLPNGEESEKFFKKFGFEIISKEKSNKRFIRGDIDSLKIFPLQDIEVLDIEKIVSEWQKFKSIYKFSKGIDNL